MKKINKEIADLAYEIMIDITNDRLKLHNIMLKSSRLSLLLSFQELHNWFKENARLAEKNQFIVETLQKNMEATKDPNISLSSVNPNEYTNLGIRSNMNERILLRNESKNALESLSYLRTETYKFSLSIYNKWRFGNVVQNIFEKKRIRTEPTLYKIFPDINNRIGSINENINSNNPEDWKNAVASCRTLLMDIADILNPVKKAEDKSKYINRLKDFVSPKSKTKKSLIDNLLDELKNRIEYTINMAQGGAHQDRPLLHESEDVVFYTYLIISELINLYILKES